MLGAVIRLPSPCLVVLVGASGSGKTTWATSQFLASQVVSADALRSLVGEGEHDQRAGTDAFAVLDLVLARRARRGLTTVVDTTGLEPKRRRGYLDLARANGMACVAVLFDTAPEVCRERNRKRDRPVPAPALAGQLRSMANAADAVGAEGFDAIHAPDEVRIVPSAFAAAPAAAQRQRDQPMTLRFGLQVPNFTWPGGPRELGSRLAVIAGEAEAAGFDSFWVMDHFLQIPQVGREWLDMLDSYTALAFVAGQTSRIRLGTMVTGVTYRNIAHLAKVVATLDVLSGGRAICGIGAAWFEREHRAYGFEFPPISERYLLLEDALQLLPLMWGPGSPTFEGHRIKVAEAMCYPRPLQDRVPILVGGSGERKTLRFVAQYADACNLFGEPDVVAHKVEVLGRHCDDVGRDRAQIEVTQLSTALVAADDAAVGAAVERLKPASSTAEAFANRVNAGTVDDHVGRFRALGEAGVQTAVVNLPDVAESGALDRFASVIAAFRA